MARSETDVENSEDDLAYAIGRYALGKISVGRAAEIAGVSRWKMQDILESVGIQLKHGPRDTDELRQDVDVAMSLGESNANGEE